MRIFGKRGMTMEEIVKLGIVLFVLALAIFLVVLLKTYGIEVFSSIKSFFRFGR